ncbi:MAG: murein biosynthesis integral membrane protein MurJ [Anaerolineae bacterium]|nr:murein biosynthesis integral membrane protein MurJ [Anaerolineae bacterium]
MSQNNPPSLFRAAGTVAFAILFGQLMGLLRGALVADAFPVAELDAFFAANRVSETLFTLLAAGALGSAFMPTFTGLLVKGEKDSAWRLAASLARLLTLTLSLVAVIAAVFAPQIVRYFLAPGFYADPPLFMLTVDLLRIQLVSAILFGLGGLLVGVLNAHHIFFIPQLTAAMYQIGQIFGVLVLARWFGIYGLACGVVTGSAFYLLIQIPTLLKLLKTEARPSTATPKPGVSAQELVTEHWSLNTDLRNPAVLQVLRLMGPRVLGAGVVQLNFWVNTWLASQMIAGSVASLVYGFALMVMAQAVIAQSVAIAVMPTFSAQFALGKRDEMRAALSSALRGVLLLALPASLGLMLLASPIVSMLYQRGKFDEIAVQMTAWALIWYAAGMIGHSLLEVLTRAFYARQDTKTPVVVGVAAMSLNVLLSFAFSAWFRQIGWMPHGGLALANSLATALEAAALFILMRRQLDGVQGRSIADGLLRFGLSALGMGLALAAWLGFSAGMNPWLVGLGGVAIGGAVYGVLLIILRVSEVQMILRIIKSRLPG